MTNNLPEHYEWILSEPGPKMIVEAMKLFGTFERPGVYNNPEIMSWAKELGLENQYSGDDVPWCGLFMGVVAKRAGKDIPPSPLWALSWTKFGTESKQAMLGDVLVFRRNGGGHVTLYVGEDEVAYHCLGGNQSDRVCITRIGKERLYAIRRPQYKIAQPANVRKILLSPTGVMSTNES